LNDKVQLILFTILETSENKDMGHMKKKMETTHCKGPKCSPNKLYYVLRYVHFMLKISRYRTPRKHHCHCADQILKDLIEP